MTLHWTKTAAVAMALLALAGCKNIKLGGFMESVSDGNQKATFGGTFDCTPTQYAEGSYLAVVDGQFQFRDHGETITLNGKDRKFAFHGTVDQVGFLIGDASVCEQADALLAALFEEGYCGPVQLQPKPAEGDPLYGVDLFYFVGGEDNGEPGMDAGDMVSVRVGTETPIPEEHTGCPALSGGGGLIYENSGPLLNGNVQIPLDGGI